MKRTIILNESELKGLIRDCLIETIEEQLDIAKRIINEEYEEIGSVEFELENGVKTKSEVSLRNKGGKQTYHIGKDDGCYVPYSEDLKTGKCKPTYYIFPEMFAAMKKLPKLPLV
jgi:hypothetical protein